MAEPMDLTGLPDELLAELSCAKVDHLSRAIVGILSEEDGPMSLDNILVMLFRARGKIYKRRVIQNKLYRMEEVEPSTEGKGFFQLHPAVKDSIKGGAGHVYAAQTGDS